MNAVASLRRVALSARAAAPLTAALPSRVSCVLRGAARVRSLCSHPDFMPKSKVAPSEDVQKWIDNVCGTA